MVIRKLARTVVVGRGGGERKIPGSELGLETEKENEKVRT